MPDETSKLLTVLIVEDDPLLSKMYQTKFQSEGFKTLVAPDGQKGFELATTEKVDLIILDIMMPHVSGIELLRKLRVDKLEKDTPVVILTNLTQKEDQEEAKKLGVFAYLLKAELTPREVVEQAKAALGITNPVSA